MRMPVWLTQKYMEDYSVHDTSGKGLKPGLYQYIPGYHGYDEFYMWINEQPEMMFSSAQDCLKGF